MNDLPNISQFHTTLFADNTFLMIVDKNLETLEIKVNEQIRHVDYWLCKNKLSLNYSKTNYLLIHKQPKKTVHENFVIHLNDKTLKRSSTVKYLGLFIDDTLNWSSHVNYLSHQLARFSGVFYRLCNYVNKETLLHALL